MTCFPRHPLSPQLTLASLPPWLPGSSCSQSSTSYSLSSPCLVASRRILPSNYTLAHHLDHCHYPCPAYNLRCHLPLPAETSFSSSLNRPKERSSPSTSSPLLSLPPSLRPSPSDLDTVASSIRIQPTYLRPSPCHDRTETLAAPVVLLLVAPLV